LDHEYYYVDTSAGPHRNAGGLMTALAIALVVLVHVLVRTFLVFDYIFMFGFSCFSCFGSNMLFMFSNL
jgi:hypothetical protein